MDGKFLLVVGLDPEDEQVAIAMVPAYENVAMMANGDDGAGRIPGTRHEKHEVVFFDMGPAHGVVGGVQTKVCDNGGVDALGRAQQRDVVGANRLRLRLNAHQVGERHVERFGEATHDFLADGTPFFDFVNGGTRSVAHFLGELVLGEPELDSSFFYFFGKVHAFIIHKIRN